MEKSNANDDDYFNSYHTYEEIVDWTNKLVADHPNICTLIKVGSTYQGNDINVRYFLSNFSMLFGQKRHFF